MKNTFPILILFLTYFLTFFAQGQGELKSFVSGALIVVEKENPVSFMNAQGEPLSENIEIGSVLEQGSWAITGKEGKLSFLMSNGTLVTMLPDSKMKVGDFKQLPFDPGNRKVSDLTKEPSASEATLDLELGSLVVKTKKLDKKSSFQIATSLGVAGIRGTEFQLGVNTGNGFQLDVTESTVAFTPPGGTTTPISQGAGLDFSGTGSVVPRALNPAVAQSIATTTAAATLASNNISLSAVTNAMVQTAQGTEEGGDGAEEESEDSDEDSDSSEGSDSEGSDSQESSTGSEGSSSNSMIDTLLESDPDAKQTRETGKVSTNSKRMAGLPFTQRQLARFYGFSETTQTELLDVSFEDATRLLDLEAFTQVHATDLFSLSKEAQVRLMSLEDNQLISLLDAKLDEEFILTALSTDAINEALPDKQPDGISISDLNKDILDLADDLRASGNADVFEKIEEINGGSWTEDWVKVAQVGNILSTEYDLLQDWSSMPVLSFSEAINNPFFETVSTLFNQLLLDSLDAGSDPVVLGGLSLSLGAESYNFTEMLGDKTGLLMGATDKLTLDGVINLQADGMDGVRFIAASGGAIEVAKGTSIKSTLADLVISAREDVLMQEVSLESTREVALRSLRDLQLNQVSITAADRVHLRASRNLDVDGLQLSQSLPSLIMEATTIRLSNVDFPSATAVQLNSLKGPVDGRYPNFGTGVSLEQQLGRVNFIENVRSGGNLLNDRPSFDQFGGNISIGKMVNP